MSGHVVRLIWSSNVISAACLPCTWIRGKACHSNLKPHISFSVLLTISLSTHYLIYSLSLSHIMIRTASVPNSTRTPVSSPSTPGSRTCSAASPTGCSTEPLFHSPLFKREPHPDVGTLLKLFKRI